MSTTPTPTEADPTDPSPVTPTPNSPRPTLEQERIPISFNVWQPQPTPLDSTDLIAFGCPHETTSTEYFLDLVNNYQLRVVSGGNHSLAGLELSGIYHLDSMQDPPSSGFRASFNGQEMDLSTGQPYTSDCARFTFSVQLDINIPEGSTAGTLTFPGSIAFSPILITSAGATLQSQAPPVASSTSTFDDGFTSTVDSSIGQSTNETALPASGNVPVSASSSSSGPKASVIAPAVVVPMVFVLAALAAFFLWRRHRRARLAPSAAFRADNADAVEAMQRQGGTVGLGGTGTSQVPTAGVSLPAQSSSYFPLDEKRPLGP